VSIQSLRTFISYSRKNKEFVEKLVAKLQNRCTLWWDQRLTPAEIWWSTILDEIERCDCFVLILTQAYTASVFCLTELEYAQKLGKPILSVVPDRTVKFPPGMGHSQAAFIEGFSVSEAFGEIIAGISGLKSDQYIRPDGTVPRPPEPTPTGQVQLTDLYADAAEAEAAGNDSLAERFYEQVTKLADGVLHQLASERLAALQQARSRRANYENILRLAANPKTLNHAVDLWTVYVYKYGNEYDPQGFAWDVRFNRGSPTAPIYVASLGPEIQILSFTPGLREPQAGDWRIHEHDVSQVYVPTGSFMMGSNDGYSAEEPLHTITITNPFWLDLTPVTNEAYEQFINDGGYQTETWWTPGGWQWVQDYRIVGPFNTPPFADPKQPRVGVAWFAAYGYAKWRGGRLPTEAEWEWAARGPENRIYPWGNSFDAKLGIYNENSKGKSATVGKGIRTAGASWVGALDMSGNVWEWCSSLHKPYPYKEDDGRESISNASDPRVARSGSWLGNQGDARAACRNLNNPAEGSMNIGFRVVAPVLG
jgi:formylglycine-generating enzyme required for sulfatase activity